MKRIIYLFICALAMVHISCNKDLGKLPENAKVDGNTIISQATSEIALNGVYYRFANIDASSNTTGWFEHEVPPGMFAGYLGYGFGADPGEENDYSNSGYADVHWATSYSLINAANGVIEGVTALSDKMFTNNRKNEILAEARFMRAYGHFKLLSFYAQWFDLSSAYGVLLREDFVTLANIAKKRSTVAESYTSVLTDLDYAIANAPAVNDNIYVTRYAAMALKMRVLMSHAETADYTTAISLADSIILNSSYTLENNTKDIFYTKALTSKEVILGIQPEQNQEAYYYNLSHQYYPGASGLYVAKDELKTLLQDDPRSSWMIGPVNAYGGYYFLKYIAAGSNPSIISETAYVFRLSETYLLKAEAIVRSGGSLADARAILKTIMGHAGVTDFSSIDNATTQDEMRMQIYLEIARNLVGEDGQEWMALLRLPLATVQQLRPTITDKIRYILPIPHIEFVSNPAIGDQNPGYQK